jgi:hypothetical protein
MKTIITIWNTAGKGKSSTILELANLLINNSPNHKIIFCNKNVKHLTIDFRLIIEINGKKIALESQGDPGTELEKRLNEIVTSYHPVIIFCTSRTRGETVYAIENISNTFDFDTIWTSTYQATRNHQIANKAKAEHLMNLLSKFGLI